MHINVLCIQKIPDIVRLFFKNSLTMIYLIQHNRFRQNHLSKKLISVGLCNYTRYSDLHGIRLLNYQTFYYYLRSESPAISTEQLKTNGSIELQFLETRGDLNR
jgi:hypothetical protein